MKMIRNISQHDGATKALFIVSYKHNERSILLPEPHNSEENLYSTCG